MLINTPPFYGETTPAPDLRGGVGVDDRLMREPRLLTPGLAPIGRMRPNYYSQWLSNPLCYAIWHPNSNPGNLLGGALTSGTFTLQKGGAYCTGAITLETKIPLTTDPDTRNGGLTGLMHGIVTSYGSYQQSLYTSVASSIKNQSTFTRLESGDGPATFPYASHIVSAGDEVVVLRSNKNSSNPNDNFIIFYNVTKRILYNDTDPNLVSNFTSPRNWYGGYFGVSANTGIVFMQARWDNAIKNDARALDLVMNPYQILIPA